MYRIIRERVSMPDQGQAVGVMAGESPGPQPRTHRVDVPTAERRRPRNMTRIWQMVMPPEVFEGSMQLVHQAIPDGWEELSRRIRNWQRERKTRKGAGRGGSGRPSPVVPEPLRRVGVDFEDEYPGATALATECFANLFHAGNLLMELHNRQTREEYQLSPSARQVLAVVEGAGQPLEPSVIAERVLITTGSMTSILDTLEKRGLIKPCPTLPTAASSSWTSLQPPRPSSTSSSPRSTPERE